jgi:hypothetical protein
MKNIFLSVTTVILFSQNIFAQTNPSNNPPSFKKVFIVLLENTDYSKALKQPFLAELAKGGALLTNYDAVAHPSYPNYLALTSGSTQGRKSDNVIRIDSRNIADLLEAKGKTWKNYAEDHPGDCRLKGIAKYAPKHIPFLSYADIQDNSERCAAHIVDASQLLTDVQNGTLPDYSFYTPNMNNDGHDTNATYASKWLQGAFGPLLQDPKFIGETLFIVTFDEDDNLFGANQVYTVLYGPSVIAGSTSDTKLNHYSLLRTIEDTLGLGTLGQSDASAIAITGVWN